MKINPAIALLALALSGCADLSAVGTFAKESSVISSNKGMLDDSNAQTEVRSYALKNPSPGTDQNSIRDPSSETFKLHVTVTGQALVALNNYMTVLAQLSSHTSESVDSDAGKIGSALKSLHVTDPAVTPTINATSALSGIVLDAMVRKDVAELITRAHASVSQITEYLSAQAQVTSNEYTQAIGFNQKYWGDVTQQTQADKEFCAHANLCKSVYVLATRARDAEDATLSAKATAAAAAATAFQKIGKDNDALAANADHLNSADLISILKADEPDLLNSISSLQSL